MCNILDGMTPLWDALKDLNGKWEDINNTLQSKRTLTTAKKTPKKPEHAARAMSFPISCLGSADRRWSRYIAGMALTKRIPIPPAAAGAVVCEHMWREFRW